MKRFFLSFFIFAIALGLGNSDSVFASKSNQIDDITFYDYGSMSEPQIASWISSNFPSSCLLPQNYPAEYSNNSAWRNTTFKEPLSYFTYGGETSPARIIWRASQFYSLNPKVLLTTLEKESDLITGSKGCSAWRYNSAMGYNCPTGAEEFLKDYPNLGIYDTCVQTESYAGFSPQVNKAAWQLSFDGKRANGDLSWMGDGNVTYYGRMTQGYRARVNGGAVNYYDGYTTINGESVYLENGPTAALYNYTPFFTRFESIYTGWFGPTQAPAFSAQPVWQQVYTDNTKATALGWNATLMAGQSAYAVVVMKNVGNTTWTKSGAFANTDTRLATYGPWGRNSQFCNGSWLINCTRPAALKEASVAPGQYGTFEFPLRAPNTAGNYSESFAPVVDGRTVFSSGAMAFNISVTPVVFSAQPVWQQVYTDNTKATALGWNANLISGQSAYVVVVMKNTGNVRWTKSGAFANTDTRLATYGDWGRSSPFCDNSWLISCSRPAGLKEAVVEPGQYGSFEFTVKAPAKAGSYSEAFAPIIDGRTVFSSGAMAFNINVSPASFSAQPVWQQVYTDNTKATALGWNATLMAGQSAYAVVVMKNVGNTTWTKSGAFANTDTRLATYGPWGRNSQFCNGSWLINCTRPAALKEASVAPGQYGTFEFPLRAPNTAGNYSESFAPVVDGRTVFSSGAMAFNISVQ